MLDLSYVLEFIVDGLDNGPFTQQNPVIHRPESTFHIVFQPGYQLYTINEELTEKVLADISFVAHEFAVYELHERFHFQRLAVIDISRSDHEIQDLAPVVADKVQLEAEKPTEGTFATLRHALEYLVHMDALVSADPEQCTVHKTDSGTLPQQTLLDEDNKLYHNGFLQFRKPVVRNGLREQMTVSDTNLIQVKVFQTLMVRGMEHDHDDDNLRL